MSTLPEVKGLTEEILNKLKKVGDIEYIRRKSWIVKGIESNHILEKYDSAVIVSELVKLRLTEDRGK